MMLGIFADTFKIAAREQRWDRLKNDDNIDEAVRQHEIRKREELRRQREQQKQYC